MIFTFRFIGKIILKMDLKEKFFSDNVAVSKENFNQNFDKLNYQRKLIKDIEKKHKEWSKNYS